MSSKTVHKALDILEKFSTETPSWGLRELARELDLNHTVVHRLLKTFEERGYLSRNEDSQKYEIGLKILELSNLVDEKYQVSKQLDAIMHTISKETGESSVFTVRDKEHGVFLKIVEGSKTVRFAESEGRRSPLCVGATHKSILAYTPKKACRGVIKKALEDRLIDDEKLIMKELEKIQEQGYAYTSGETFDDVAAIAVPIFNSNFEIIGSLGIASPTYRLTEEVAKSKVDMLMSFQKEIRALISSRKTIFE
ncbi:IclR family transcriptional regulator [Alkalicoccobacillus porphyridii]|uniref:Glycerol operon regulatory protein n=1 Tax=Alkalicoccobacillus porphyridii TaxID=2597270 RepID=A0A554A200_9BACI|nr:IclR family transcriptional regulator [Alkalicoccobacillus porphyridii]TSB47723.1 IclR family transcriptional regulator [Alkalicoccobacillus porphyridii]